MLYTVYRLINDVVIVKMSVIFILMYAIAEKKFISKFLRSAQQVQQQNDKRERASSTNERKNVHVLVI